DYFGVPKSSSGSSEKRSDSHASTPHIAFQEKGRQHSSDHDVTQAKSQPRNQSKGSDQDQSKTSPSGNEFQLQDAPRTKSLASRSNSSNSVPQDGASGKSANGISRKDGLSNLSESRKTNDNMPPPRPSQESKWQE